MKKKILAALIAALFILTSLSSISVFAIPSTHTITINFDGHGENITVNGVPEGSSIMSVLSTAIPEVPTDEGYIMYGVGTKPASEYKNYEEFVNDVMLLQASNVTGDTTVYLVWLKRIDEVRFTVDAPVCGTDITAEWHEANPDDQYDESGYDWDTQTNPPVVTFENPDLFYLDKVVTYWLTYDEDADWYDLFIGMIVGGEEYLAGIDNIYPVFPYYIDEETVIIANGEEVEGGPYEYDYGPEIDIPTPIEPGYWAPGGDILIGDPDDLLISHSFYSHGMWADVYVTAVHDWDEWKTVKEPDFNETGLKRRECKANSEHVEEETIPALEGALVKYDLNGGVADHNFTEQFTFEIGTEWTIADPATENFAHAPEGYEFDGIEIDGVRYGVGDKYTLEKDITMKMLWKKAGVDNSNKSPIMGYENTTTAITCAIFVLLVCSIGIVGAFKMRRAFYR